MPNRNTFSISPIAELIHSIITDGQVIVDPFANSSKIATITNDLNPEFDTDFHLDALEFLKSIGDCKADIVLFDPPYSITQATECYYSYGKDKLEVNVANMKYWKLCKDNIARILKPNGLVICCGWNSNGLGKGRGFEMLKVLIINHGGSRNDTLVTVEKKLPSHPSLFNI